MCKLKGKRFNVTVKDFDDCEFVYTIYGDYYQNLEECIYEGLENHIKSLKNQRPEKEVKMLETVSGS